MARAAKKEDAQSSDAVTHPTAFVCMSSAEAFLSHLAEQRTCSTNTQRIALNALVYLYKQFMGLDIGDLVFKPALGAPL